MKIPRFCEFVEFVADVTWPESLLVAVVVVEDIVLDMLDFAVCMLDVVICSGICCDGLKGLEHEMY